MLVRAPEELLWRTLTENPRQGQEKLTDRQYLCSYPLVINAIQDEPADHSSSNQYLSGQYDLPDAPPLIVSEITNRHIVVSLIFGATVLEKMNSKSITYRFLRFIHNNLQWHMICEVMKQQNRTESITIKT